MRLVGITLIALSFFAACASPTTPGEKTAPIFGSDLGVGGAKDVPAGEPDAEEPDEEAPPEEDVDWGEDAVVSDAAAQDAGKADVAKADVMKADSAQVDGGPDGKSDAGKVDAGPDCSGWTYAKDIQPLFKQYCSQCHKASTDFPNKCPTKGKPALISTWLTKNAMPPKEDDEGNPVPPIAAEDKATVLAWIKAGSKCTIAGCP